MATLVFVISVVFLLSGLAIVLFGLWQQVHSRYRAGGVTLVVGVAIAVAGCVLMPAFVILAAGHDY